MSLTLTLANVDRLENNQSTRLVLDRHGALIGRSPSADWTLPDPRNHISYTHCEIVYKNGSYILNDKSTNGTFVNNARERVKGPYTLVNGDELAIGHYRILVRVSEGAGAEEPAKTPAAPAQPWGWDEARAPQQEDDGWGSAQVGQPPSAGWEPAPAPPPIEPRAAPQWSLETAAAQGDSASAPQWRFEGPAVQSAPAPPPQWNEAPAAAISGRGPLRDNFAPPRAVEPSQGGDVWSRFAASNAIDWQAGGFQAPAPPAPPPAASPAGRHNGAAWSDAPPPREPPALPPVQAAPPAPAAPPLRGADAAWSALLAAAGLAQSDLKSPPTQTGTAAGSVLRRLVAGLIVLLEARARAKAELGAVSTTIEIAGNNPLKFTRDPEAALARLLNPPERGYMESDRAVEDAFKDLQAHQMATLAAMQGALRATLVRFSPEAIRGRAEQQGLLARILPGARAAALWEAYEREFEGVVQGSDEAFMDTFARAFKDAYQKACAEMRR